NIIFEFLTSHTVHKDIFHKFINKTPSKIRFIQYYLSIMLGKLYFSHIKGISANFTELHFKSSEIINLFGKDLGIKLEHFYLHEEIKPLNIELSASELIPEKIFTDILHTIQIKGYNIVQ